MEPKVAQRLDRTGVAPVRSTLGGSVHAVSASSTRTPRAAAEKIARPAHHVVVPARQVVANAEPVVKLVTRPVESAVDVTTPLTALVVDAVDGVTAAASPVVEPVVAALPGLGSLQVGAAIDTVTGASPGMSAAGLPRSSQPSRDDVKPGPAPLPATSQHPVRRGDLRAVPVEEVQGQGQTATGARRVASTSSIPHMPHRPSPGPVAPDAMLAAASSQAGTQPGTVPAILRIGVDYRGGPRSSYALRTTQAFQRPGVSPD